MSLSSFIVCRSNAKVSAIRSKVNNNKSLCDFRHANISVLIRWVGPVVSGLLSEVEMSSFSI